MPTNKTGYMSEYYKKNKEKYETYFTCSCGRDVRLLDKTKHLHTKIHYLLLQNKRLETIQSNQRSDQQANQQADQQADKQADKQVDQQADQQANQQADQQADKQADQQANQQADQQINKNEFYKICKKLSKQYKKIDKSIAKINILIDKIKFVDSYSNF